MTERLDFIAVMGRLNRAAREAGGISALARKLGMPRQDVHAALHASRAPSASLLAAVGVRRVVTTTYETIDPPAPSSSSEAVHILPDVCADPTCECQRHMQDLIASQEAS